jgi:hypothetical protein
VRLWLLALLVASHSILVLIAAALAHSHYFEPTDPVQALAAQWSMTRSAHDEGDNEGVEDFVAYAKALDHLSQPTEIVKANQALA